MGLLVVVGWCGDYDEIHVFVRRRGVCRCMEARGAFLEILLDL